jgi:hypothetical protein
LSDPELDSFKTSIDLRAYAASQGYALDRKESYKGTAVMRHSNGDKLLINRGLDGHYLYCSVRDDDDNGTIIDFVQRRKRLNLGQVRSELRAFSNTPSPLPAFAALPKTTKDRMAVEAQFARMHSARRHPYLETERGLPAELLQRERFDGTVMLDSKGNAVFPHYDQDGLCGYEIKNDDFTSFSPGGSKGLWSSRALPDDERLGLFESTIDALSYAFIFPEERMRYASVGGKLSPIQPELIRAAISRMPLNAEIVAAFDADKGGRDLAEVVRRAVDLSGRNDLRFCIQEPVDHKDWNDQVTGKRPVTNSAVQTREPFVA